MACEKSEACLALSLMDAQLVAIGIHYDCGAASRRRDKRLNGKWHLVLPQILDRSFEILHFQAKMRPVARRLQKRFFPDRERMRTDFILDPEPVALLHRHRGGEPENILIERARPRHIRGGVNDESKFDN